MTRLPLDQQVYCGRQVSCGRFWAGAANCTGVLCDRASARVLSRRLLCAGLQCPACEMRTVLAVYMPPHAPAPGHALCTMSCRCSSVIRPAEYAPAATATVQGSVHGLTAVKYYASKRTKMVRSTSDRSKSTRSG